MYKRQPNKPSKKTAKLSPIILERCLELIKIANNDAATDEKENIMHIESTAVRANELKNQRARRMLIPKNSYLIRFV